MPDSDSAPFASWSPLVAIFVELGLTPESTELMDILAGRGDLRGAAPEWGWHSDDPYGGTCWIRAVLPPDEQGYRVTLIVDVDGEWGWQALVQDRDGVVRESYISLQSGGARAMMNAADRWWTFPENQAGMAALIQEAQKAQAAQTVTGANEDATA